MSRPGLAEPLCRNAPLDALRSFVTLLVIAHHSLLAYHPYAPAPGAFSRDNLSWGAFPIVSEARGPGLEVLVLWNDSFFMALMFLVSGLFVWPSLQRKGGWHFLRDRLLRLGVPWLIAGAMLAPLAYYPAYLQRGPPGAGFASAWLSLGVWLTGPAWFLWVLLVFGALAALLHRVASERVVRVAALAARGATSPVRFIAGFIGVALLAYVPLSYVVSAEHWFLWGPFAVQTSRGLLYACYFFGGLLLGASGSLFEGWVAPQGALARRWGMLQALASVIFAVFVVCLTLLGNAGQERSMPALALATRALFATTGVTTSFALLASFARKCTHAGSVLRSLSRNAFGMYLVHYAIVSWLQFGLLRTPLPGALGALVVTVAAILLSWAATSALLAIPRVARFI